MLTETQLRTLQRARETLTTVQSKVQDCTDRGFDQGRIVEACAAKGTGVFETLRAVAKVVLQELNKGQ